MVVFPPDSFPTASSKIHSTNRSGFNAILVRPRQSFPPQQQQRRDGDDEDLNFHYNYTLGHGSLSDRTISRHRRLDVFTR